MASDTKLTQWGPPKGQRCETCMCFARSGDTELFGGRCILLHLPQSCEYPITSGKDWCGHWRGKGVTCGGCRWHGRNECPRTLSTDPDFSGHCHTLAPQVSVTMTPRRDAFPCDRYEEE